MNPDDLLAQQVEYYRARAPEYDQWWLREGSYDLGDEYNQAWARDVAEVEAVLDDFAPTGDVLELAAGTGLWSQRLVHHAHRLTCVDASPETLELNRSRTAAAGVPVDYQVADVFAWKPPRRFDVVFFSFWLSHVPPSRFDEFWALVDAALAPGGRVLFFDNAQPFEALPGFHQLRGPDGRMRSPWVSSDLGDGVAERRLEDGRTFHIVKVFYDPADLVQRLDALGWEASVGRTSTFFVHGDAKRS